MPTFIVLLLLSLFHRWGNLGPERLSNLCKVTQVHLPGHRNDSCGGFLAPRGLLVLLESEYKADVASASGGINEAKSRGWEQEPQLLELWAPSWRDRGYKLSSAQIQIMPVDRSPEVWGHWDSCFMILLPIEFWGEPNAFKPDMISWIGPNSLWPTVSTAWGCGSGVGPCKTNASERASIWLVPNAEQRASGWMQRSAGLSTPASGTFNGYASNDTMFLCYVHFSDSSCRPILLYY